MLLNLLLVGAITAMCLLAGLVCRSSHQFDQSLEESRSCPACRSFLWQPMFAYAQRHEGWLPRGGRDEWDSLARGIEESGKLRETGFCTSHALRGSARREWSERGTLGESSSCFGYNEGLRIDDPDGLIVMYGRLPGGLDPNEPLWSDVHPSQGPDVAVSWGRVCLLLGSDKVEGHWEFLDEGRFQQAQAKTWEYVKNRRGGVDAGKPEPSLVHR